MSKKTRSRQRAARDRQEDQQQAENHRGGAIRATIKNPLTPAALSIASIVLASGAAAQDTALPAIDVLGASGYQTVNPGLTRSPVPIRDTPQTVNVVTQQVIQEQNVATVRDALRNVAGITFRAGEGGNQGDTPYIRGFQRRTTSSATACAIRAGTRATPSRSMRSRSTRGRRRSCSAAARPAA